MYIFPTNDLVQQHNESMLMQSGLPVVELEAVDSGSLKLSKEIPHDDNFLLQSCVKLAVGAKVFLTSNIHIEKGLYAGMKGTITEIIYQGKVDVSKTEQHSPKSVLVEFDDYKGIKLIYQLKIRIPAKFFLLNALFFQVHLIRISLSRSSEKKSAIS